MSQDKQIRGLKQTDQLDCLAFIGKSKTIKIPFAGILYIEQAGTQLLIKKEETEEELQGIIGKIRELSRRLDGRFYQCHSYLIINMARVDSMMEGKIIFDNLEEKHLGRDCFAKTRRAFNHYLTGSR